MLRLYFYFCRCNIICIDTIYTDLKRNMARSTHFLINKHFLRNNFMGNAPLHLRIQRNVSRTLQKFLHSRPVTILGIESSCDDTACGIVDEKGNVLGEAHHSQYLMHLDFGGIIPTIAEEMHRKHITKVCEDALLSANIKLKDIDAVATTVKPGLPRSLEIGTRFGKYLSRIGSKPFIPIHHMEAHALTARMIEKVDFPYLVLLISGGHCLLAIVQDVDKYYLLGTTLDNAPGEIMDKIARRLKLRYIPEFHNLNGGSAIEMAAQKASRIDQFHFPPILMSCNNCNFSFSGLYSNCMKGIMQQERNYNIMGDNTIPDIYNISAEFQLTLFTHVCQRTQRAMEFINKMSLIPAGKRTLVVSGGVACNNLLSKALELVTSDLGYHFVRTPPKLCTDNGVMIAWNGIERWIADKGVIRDQSLIDKVSVEKKSPLGEDWTEKVERANITCKWINIKDRLYS